MKMSEKNQKNKDRPEKQMLYPKLWIEILSRCLQVNPKVRWNSK